MPLRVLRLAVLTTASVVVTTTVGLGTSVPAMADDSPAPVAGDDVVTVEARSTEFGGVTLIDVLANDSAADGEVLEICRVQAPERGLSVAEAQPDGGFTIETPEAAYSSGVSGGSFEEGAREQLVVLSWANRAGTYQFTYWACDTEHLTPATVTVTVTKTPEVTVRKVDRPGRLRFTNPRTSRAVVIYGGLDQDRPDGRVRLAPGTHRTQRVERRAIRWVAFAPRTGQTIGEGVVRGIRLPGSTRRSVTAANGIEPRLTHRMLRAWRSN
ncbi:Ig-like domain-containing protein [Nocardioides sp. P5_E3]